MLLNAVLPGIVLLGVVIFVHELGHFLAAKWRRVRVLRFSLGFGPALIKFTRGETEYRLSWIPLGGYVQMAGDAPEADGTMPQGRDEFLSHPWPGRLAIAFAGPLANLVTAFLVMVVVGMTGVSYPDFPNRLGATADTSFAHRFGLREGDQIVAVNGTPVTSWIGIFVTHSEQKAGAPVDLQVLRGDQRLALRVPAEQREPLFSSLRRPETPAVVGAVVTGMPAYKAGIREGDRILAVQGHPIRTWDELPAALRGKVDTPVTLRLQRGRAVFDLAITPMSSDGRNKENALIGIEAPRGATYVERHGPVESVVLAARATVGIVGSVYSGMWLTFSRPIYYREYLGGPLFIAQAARDSARRGIDSYLQFLALINVAIMAFNLLPLPVLDGGHILLALIEGVRRRAVSAQAYLRFQKVGLVVIGLLFVLILANDPLRVVQRQRALEQAPRSAPPETTVAPAPP